MYTYTVFTHCVHTKTLPILLAADVSENEAPSEYANSSPLSVDTSLPDSKSDLFPTTLNAKKDNWYENSYDANIPKTHVVKPDIIYSIGK